MREFFEESIRIIVYGIVYGFGAFLVSVAALIMLASFALTFVLIADLVIGKTVQWYEIVAPFIFFLGIGIALFTLDD